MDAVTSSLLTLFFSPWKFSTVPLESEYWRHCSPYRHFVIHPGTWLSFWGCCTINPQPLIQYWKYFVGILSSFSIIYCLRFDAKPTVLSTLFPLSVCCHSPGPHLTSFPFVHTLWCFKHTLMTFICVSSPRSHSPVRIGHFIKRYLLSTHWRMWKPVPEANPHPAGRRSTTPDLAALSA